MNRSQGFPTHEASQTDGLSQLPIGAQRAVCCLLIVIAGAMAAGRVASVNQVFDPNLFRGTEERNSKRVWLNKKPAPVPTLSSNDRSRWLTVRALLENGTYSIGKRDIPTVAYSAVAPIGCLQPVAIVAILEAGKNARIASDRGPLFEDGWNSIDRVMRPDTLEFYSSKPPLFPTLMAGSTWALEKVTGWKLKNDPAAVVRTSLWVWNVLPFMLYLGVFASLVFQLTTNAWVRIVLVAAACFGTMVTPFLITINNHTPAVFLATFALGALMGPGQPGLGRALLAGGFAGFAFSMELPALALVAGLPLLMLGRASVGTFAAYLLAASIFILALGWCNWISLERILPAYSEFGGPWYDYEGSPWQPYDAFGQPKRNIDFARRHLGETRLEYAFHFLVGHHGLFSLTPLFLVSLAGALIWTSSLLVRPSFQNKTGLLGLLTLGLTATLVAFYLYKSDNYGGVSCANRWLIWLTPLLLLSAIPALETLSRYKSGRTIVFLFVAVGVFSASWPAWTPWKLPWLYDLMMFLGWPGYA
jgi:hypothetical protein